MSLHHAAQHLAAQGRGPDNTLVHMSKDEVAGLQAIAKMKGGSLTVNPQTGMAEAGFLDDLMPTLVGAAGAYFGLDPMTTAAIMGGGTAISTGDVGKGLMAGLGAYGGGNMMQSALGAGGTSLADAATKSMTNPYDVADMAEGTISNATNAQKLAAFDPSVAGLGGYKNMAMAAAPAIMGMLQPQQAQAPQGREQMIRPYKFDYNKQDVPNKIGTAYQPGQDTSERLWFQPTYTALPPYKAAGGGLMDLQSMAGGGGPVEAMSNANAVGANTGYPQADIEGHAYATPWQTPVSQNVVQGTADTGVDRMTGEMMFAAGGVTGSGGIDLHIPLDLGGGTQGANGYQAAGSGSGNLTNEERPSWAQQGMPYSYTHGMQQPQTPPQFGFAMQQAQPNFLAGIDPTGIMSGAPRQASFAGPGTAATQGGIADMMRSMLQKQGADQMSPDKRAQLQAMYRNAGMQVYAEGGMTDLGGYASGGNPRLLKGPGDGMSDNIPAVIGGKQPARLADGEFVVPADVVSHLGNGSTEAGAKQLYKMMDRIRQQRTGKKKQAPQVNPSRAMPA